MNDRSWALLGLSLHNFGVLIQRDAREFAVVLGEVDGWHHDVIGCHAVGGNPG